MSRDVASLLAQVIPLLILAMLLELRAILRTRSSVRDPEPEPTSRPAGRIDGKYALIMVGIYGFMMLVLARSGAVALFAASGVLVPKAEFYVAIVAASVALGVLVVVAVGTGVYRHFSGWTWPSWLRLTFVGAGFLVGAWTGLTVLPYLVATT